MSKHAIPAPAPEALPVEPAPVEKPKPDPLAEAQAENKRLLVVIQKLSADLVELQAVALREYARYEKDLSRCREELAARMKKEADALRPKEPAPLVDALNGKH